MVLDLSAAACVIYGRHMLERVEYLHDGPSDPVALWGDKASQQRDIERAHQMAEDYRNEEG